MSEELRGSEDIEPIREDGLMHSNQWTTLGFSTWIDAFEHTEDTHTHTNTHWMSVL